MRNAFIRVLICSSLFVVAATVPCEARSPQASDGSIKLNIISGIPVVDGVFLNGNGPFRFLLDTGAQDNQIDLSIAGRLGLVAISQVDMITPTGSGRVADGRVAEVFLGTATAHDQEFLFTALEGARVVSPDIQGVLGQQFLSHFDYLLDYDRRRLVFGAKVPEDGDRIGFKMIHGCPVIETSEGRLTLDSGANAVLLYRSPSSAAPEQYAPTVRTGSGTASVTALGGLRLRIAGREYRPVNAAATIRGALAGDDGVVSANLFRAVFVSNSGKYLVMNPGRTEKF